MRKKRLINVLTVITCTVCIFLAVSNVLPFWAMFMDTTRSTMKTQQHAIAFLPSTHAIKNLGTLLGKSFNLAVGFMNSLLISVGATVCATYFSTMTAYGSIVYSWRFRKPFFSFIMAIMMIPAQVTTIGLYQMVYRIHMTNHLTMLILSAIASPPMVLFMRQYMLSALSVEIIQTVRVDGAGGFYIFNKTAFPIMKPATVTQVIFSFVASWSSPSTSSILPTDKSRYTMPVMMNLLRGDVYKAKYDSVYPGLAFTVLPLIVVHLLLSKYIIADVALGSVKGQAIVIARPEPGALRR